MINHSPEQISQSVVDIFDAYARAGSQEEALRLFYLSFVATLAVSESVGDAFLLFDQEMNLRDLKTVVSEHSTK